MEKVEKRPITGYEGRYSVTKTGEVYSHLSNRVLKPWVINSGYQVVGLQEKRHLVHRLVAREFCEGYQEGLDVNHKDGDRLNNHPSNLEWVTRQENIRDMMKRGTIDYTTAQNVAKEANKKRIRALDKDTLEEVKTFNSLKEAREWLGVTTNLNLTRAHQTGTVSGGYRWELLNDDIV